MFLLKPMNVLGIKIVSHDPGAALIGEKGVFAISEERLNRIKYSKGLFPKRSIEYCLEAAGIGMEDIDLVVIDQLMSMAEWDMEKILREQMPLLKDVEVKVINHHLAHAASVFFASPFEEAAIMIVDGAGEKFEDGKRETDTLWYGKGNEIALLQRSAHLYEKGVFPETFGVGKLYSLITRSFLNFGQYEEGKTMGLSSYGHAERIFKEVPKEHWYKEMNGNFVCNARFSVRGSNFITRLYQLFMMHMRGGPFPIISLSRRFRPRRDPLPDDYYNDVAAAVQEIIEEVFVGMSRVLYKKTGSGNLCLAGGCALNGPSNNKILDDGKFKRIFIQPASSDTGIPLGCALYGYHAILGQKRSFVMKHADLGASYEEKDIREALENKKDKIEFRKSEAIAKESAQLLADKKIIGWFQGRSVYGPRALGERSILCHPSPKDMKDILNEKVKHRENWRPFAASVLLEHMHEYFELNYEESPFMLLVAPVKADKKDAVSAVVHVDGTCRIQTVTKGDNGPYYDLIKEFQSLTGTPLVLNTSFNLAGEPIVETPEDAIRCFLNTRMDALVLEDYIVFKRTSG